MTSLPPNTFFVLIHSRGPRWRPGVSFRDEPEMQRHIGYIREQLDAGRLVLSGPFLDDAGGMTVLRAESLDAAEAIARADSTVADGLLSVTVRPWMVAMETVLTG